jgi:AcrR family transcriptional regulator
VSPARARTSVDAIVAAGRELLDQGGLDAVTMQAVAERVAVRAPSLYKRLPSRAALIAAIGAAAVDDLAGRIAPLAADPDPADAIRRMASAVRAFAHANPRAYELIFLSQPDDARPPAERTAAASAPVLAAVERLVGRERALDAARLVTAFTHGFVSMELNGAFRLGGDVDEGFRYGMDRLIAALVADGAGGTREAAGSRTASPTGS